MTLVHLYHHMFHFVEMVQGLVWFVGCYYVAKFSGSGYCSCRLVVISLLSDVAPIPIEIQAFQLLCNSWLQFLLCIS